MAMNLNSAEPTRLLGHWRLSFDADMVLRGQGALPAIIRARRPGSVTLAERAIEEGQQWIEPQVAFRCVDIREVTRARVVLQDGGVLEGAGIARKLAGAKKSILAVATLGRRFEKQQERLANAALSWQLALDGFGTAAIGALTTEAERFFERLAGKEGLRTTLPLSPGMKDWDVAAGQAQIFSLVDAHLIGVVLNSCFVMTPRKSVSWVIGLGARIEARGLSCDECRASPKCRHKVEVAGKAS